MSTVEAYDGLPMILLQPDAVQVGVKSIIEGVEQYRAQIEPESKEYTELFLVLKHQSQNEDTIL